MIDLFTSCCTHSKALSASSWPTTTSRAFFLDLYSSLSIVCTEHGLCVLLHPLIQPGIWSCPLIVTCTRMSQWSCSSLSCACYICEQYTNKKDIECLGANDWTAGPVTHPKHMPALTPPWGLPPRLPSLSVYGLVLICGTLLRIMQAKQFLYCAQMLCA